MPTVTVNGITVSYEESTEYRDRASIANAAIDSVASELQDYIKQYSKITDYSAAALDTTGSLYKSIEVSIHNIDSLRNSFGSAFEAMKADNLTEAKKLDDEVTEENKAAAMATAQLQGKK